MPPFVDERQVDLRSRSASHRVSSPARRRRAADLLKLLFELQRRSHPCRPSRWNVQVPVDVRRARSTGRRCRPRSSSDRPAPSRPSGTSAIPRACRASCSRIVGRSRRFSSGSRYSVTTVALLKSVSKMSPWMMRARSATPSALRVGTAPASPCRVVLDADGRRAEVLGGRDGDLAVAGAEVVDAIGGGRPRPSSACARRVQSFVGTQMTSLPGWPVSGLNCRSQSSRLSPRDDGVTHEAGDKAPVRSNVGQHRSSPDRTSSQRRRKIRRTAQRATSRGKFTSHYRLATCSGIAWQRITELAAAGGTFRPEAGLEARACPSIGTIGMRLEPTTRTRRRPSGPWLDRDCRGRTTAMPGCRASCC